jgi:phage shock protein PspC (stress-responsive transcriptional regulator)
MLLPATSALGQTLALLATFLGIGVVVNGLIVYVLAQVFLERKQNRERRQNFEA